MELEDKKLLVEWISVKDRLPKEEESVWINTHTRMTEGYYRHKQWWAEDDEYAVEPTHWMPGRND